MVKRYMVRWCVSLHDNEKVTLCTIKLNTHSHYLHGAKIKLWLAQKVDVVEAHKLTHTKSHSLSLEYINNRVLCVCVCVAHNLYVERCVRIYSYTQS